MTSEDDTWAQTLITVTPEDDATLREISDTVTLSSPSDTPLILDPDKIVYRRSRTDRQFIEPQEFEETTKEIKLEEVLQQDELDQPKYQDAENQTYLQGISIVEIPVEYTDKSSQTMYMAAPCPPLKYFKDILTAMNEGPLPDMKKSNGTSTIVTFDPETSQDLVTEQLSANVPEEKLEEFASELDTDDAEMEVIDVLDFVITRLFWIIDPSQIQVDTADKETQTSLRFNNQTQILYTDNQMQTDLTCEPKESNTMLLSDYWQTKDMIVNFLDDCLSKGLETVTMTNEVINEIIDKCVERIRYPMKEEIIQTIATYKIDEDKENVLRKLKHGVVVDPLEASIIVLPLVTDLLEAVCDTVSRNAAVTVKNVVKQLLQRTDNIIGKLIKLEAELQPKPMDEILQKRKQKIIESMLKKETETISTQTSLTGVLEVKRIEESKEILCSVCKRQSKCRWCIAGDETEDIPREEVKILRTQDILLAYKPCYVITTASKKTSDLQPVCHSEPKVKLLPKSPCYVSTESTDGSRDTINICLQPKKGIKPQESFNEWSYVADATLMKPCSMKESISSIGETTMSSISKCYDNSTSIHSTLTSQAVNALQILKDTFCNQENCRTPSLQTFKQNYPFKEDGKVSIKSVCTVCSSGNNIENKLSEEQTFCMQQTCKALSKLHLPKKNTYNENTVSNLPAKSHGDGFKIIPICLSQHSNS
ncbi:uncharacterized protein LOC117607687 [Osmia lignaria lignaria]|uniref:uncharacterized protein LOC117607687 n=1 Tax=Osmia lignaria lignaria TaxID=1437193 RepID=UPI001478DEF8|nr:uncharacterized protein LOC117607687 [Osmia lignaria]XP_034187547.1 uncharacterized protein LOC117607687 [Osmia lignaria]